MLTLEAQLVADRQRPGVLRVAVEHKVLWESRCLGNADTAATPDDPTDNPLELFGDRVDYLHEIGNAQLVLGRALLEQDRLNEAEEILRAADRSFEQLSSASHRAAAWVALGDLAARSGDDAEAARLYRRAAETLQDFRF